MRQNIQSCSSLAPQSTIQNNQYQPLISQLLNGLIETQEDHRQNGKTVQNIDPNKIMIHNILQELKIFEEIKEFSVGTLDYSNVYQKFIQHQGQIMYETSQPTYVPKFPMFYENIEGNIFEKRYNFQLFRDDIFKLQSQINDIKITQNSSFQFNKAQIKFQLKSNALLTQEVRNQKEYIEQKIEQDKVQYAIELKFNNIKKVHIIYQDCIFRTKENLIIMIELNRPADVLKLTGDFKTQHYVQSPFKLSYFNIVKYVDNELVKISENPLHIYHNYWNINQVFYLKGMSNQAKITLFKQKILQCNPKIQIFEDFKDSQFLQSPQEHICTSRYIKDLFKNYRKFRNNIEEFDSNIQLSILALVSFDKLHIENWEQSLILIVKLRESKWISKEFSDYTAYVLDQLVQTHYLDPRKRPKEDIFNIFLHITRNQQELIFFKRIQNHNNSMRQRHIYITPTYTHVLPANLQESNKILRKYKNYKNDFLRVTFTSEYLVKGFYFSQYQLYKGLLNKIFKDLRGLNSKITLTSNQQYQFLGYSNSQIKSHSAWILRCNTQRPFDKKQIIKQIGNLEREESISKRSSRLGQHFSTTRHAFPLAQSQIKYIDDIYNSNFQRRHNISPTDGCGFISNQLADQISSESAFQIRSGGAKGILVRNTMLEGEVVQFRKSQIKFSSTDCNLDICRTSCYSQGYLNKQIILLLFCIGVPFDFFIETQQKALKYSSLQYMQNQVIQRIKQIQNIQNYNQNEDWNLWLSQQQNQKLIDDLSNELSYFLSNIKFLNQSIQKAILKGFDMYQDPIFLSIFKAKQLNQQNVMKTKNRILLTDSATLMGVADPFNILKENEVFIQTQANHMISNNQLKMMHKFNLEDLLNNQKKIVTGKVIVTRSPSCHPGDIQIFECVDHPQLRYLSNLIVFSTRGTQRPACNKMSCGDLDGDLYFISWNQKLLQYIRPKNIHKPAPLQHSANIFNQDEPENIEFDQLDKIAKDQVEYFTLFLERDIIGMVANKWAVLCQKYGKNGPAERDCKKLAKMHQIAVDFAKHGSAVRKQDFKALDTILKQMEADELSKQNYISSFLDEDKNILRKLSNQIPFDDQEEEFIKLDWKYSIQNDYDIDYKIIQLARRPNSFNFGMIQTNSFNHMLTYLVPVYKNIVVPMGQQIKKLMEKFCITSEGHLFSNNLNQSRNCLGPYQKEIFTNFGCFGNSDESENSLLILKGIIIECFQQEVLEMIKYYSDIDRKNEKGYTYDVFASTNIAVALYFATYYSVKHHERYCQQYIMLDLANNLDYLNFVQEVKKQEKLNDFKIQTERQQLENYGFYKQYLEDAQTNDSTKFEKLLEYKKIFSVPWLLISDELLDNYPEHYLINLNNNIDDAFIKPEINSNQLQIFTSYLTPLYSFAYRIYINDLTFRTKYLHRQNKYFSQNKPKGGLVSQLKSNKKQQLNKFFQIYISEYKNEENGDSNNQQQSSLANTEIDNIESTLRQQKEFNYIRNNYFLFRNQFINQNNQKNDTLKQVKCPLDLIYKFAKIAQYNTSLDIETCAILAGKIDQEEIQITHLIIPSQEGRYDSFEITNELTLFESQYCRELSTIGWIHTQAYTSTSLFMSTQNLHMHAGYQKQLPEAIAIVYNPQLANQTAVFEAFRIKNEEVEKIQNCKLKADEDDFHVHTDQLGGFTWEICEHVVYQSQASLEVEIIDLRKHQNQIEENTINETQLVQSEVELQSDEQIAAKYSIHRQPKSFNYLQHIVKDSILNFDQSKYNTKLKRMAHIANKIQQHKIIINNNQSSSELKGISRVNKIQQKLQIKYNHSDNNTAQEEAKEPDTQTHSVHQLEKINSAPTTQQSNLAEANQQMKVTALPFYPKLTSQPQQFTSDSLSPPPYPNQQSPQMPYSSSLPVDSHALMFNHLNKYC